MKTSIALGFFDGVHLAHKKIILAAVGYAKKNALAPVALTFDRPPAQALFNAPYVCLTDNAEKSRLIKALGAECVMLEATRKLLAMDGESFVRDILAERLDAGAVFCGYNYSFGSDRLDAGALGKLCSALGIELNVIAEVSALGEAVSSSRIRALLAEGETEKAAALLGRPYSFTGIVEHGKGLGRTKGFPTINLYPHPQKAAVPRGVYASLVSFGEERYGGVTNVGINPTVGDKNMRVETHILNFGGSLYGREATVELIRFLRPERRFETVDGLFAQIASDARQAADVLRLTQNISVL